MNEINEKAQANENELKQRKTEDNCGLCGEHILASAGVGWSARMYHADCIGKAVAQYRAGQVGIERVSNMELTELSDDDFSDEEFEERFDEDLARYEEDDDLDDIDNNDSIVELSKASGSNGFNSGLNHPPVSIAANSMKAEKRSDEIEDTTVVSQRTVTVTAADKGMPRQRMKAGTLISGAVTALVDRKMLKELPLPEETDTFKPIPHYLLVEEILKSLSFRRLQVVQEEYAVSPDGMKLFGLIELDVEYAGVRFAIGLRNANDRSMRVGLVAGYRVIVCENKMLTGDFNPLLAKHSKNFNLLDALSVAIERIQRNIGGVGDEIERKKVTLFSDSEARNLIYQAFLEQRLPISLMRRVHREYFVAPSSEEFKKPNLWSLENAFTSSFKKLKPVKQFEAAARLGKFLAPHISLF